MLQAGGCVGQSCGDRHCPGAREPSSAHFVVSLLEDSILADLQESKTVPLLCKNQLSQPLIGRVSQMNEPGNNANAENVPGDQAEAEKGPGDERGWVLTITTVDTGGEVKNSSFQFSL